MDLLNPYYLQIIVFALINVINALSVFFALSTGQISLGTAGFMSVGAYTSAILTMQMNIPIYITVIIGGFIAAIAALLIGGLTTRLNGLYLTIATIGFSEIIRVSFLNWEYVGGALGINGIPSLGSSLTNSLAASGALQTLGLNYAQLNNIVQIIILLIMITIIVLVWLRIKNSKVGRAFTSVRSDIDAAELSGINVAKYKMLSFVASAFIAGVGGAFFAHTYSTITPNDFSFNLSIDNLLYVVFGGSQIVWGSLFGAIFLTIIPEMLRTLADYREMVYGVLLLVMMIFRPQGILTQNLTNKLRNRKGNPSRTFVDVEKSTEESDES